MPWLTDDLDRSADPVVDVQRSSRRRDPGLGTIQLHHQRLIRAALQTQSAERVLIRHVHGFVTEHVHDIRVVPHALGRQRGPADLHAVDVVAVDRD